MGGATITGVEPNPANPASATRGADFRAVAPPNWRGAVRTKSSSDPEQPLVRLRCGWLSFASGGLEVFEFNHLKRYPSIRTATGPKRNVVPAAFAAFMIVVLEVPGWAAQAAPSSFLPRY